ncbi:hypothetical protein H6G74_28665 [Nostoc spongiaeforme FACHB-130]|uniref:Uncharacterized protein n=1 Tax=Nostoc spongiaeforme FACHB-130 TaxID=1357510 RepID=A0ABR8G4W4_9NOSO|nr:hypothetical protein [Nostoc spongiaeforme]MBD2598268.1 hypothetical protein [Nostoc spongiaeforme FACHB-130]
MTDPVTTIAAGAILNLAFQEFAKSGAGEVAKKTVNGAISLAKDLRDKITAKFKGNVKAEAAIAAVETEYSPAALSKLEVYLDDAMTDDAVFATELRQVAQQIINIQNQTTSNREYKNYGRDQINIEKIEGNPRIGGS